MRSDFAFLFLGETLLIPHLYPVLAAVAELAPERRIDVWTSTSTSEALIGGWISELKGASVRMRRAPGFRQIDDAEPGRNPELPAKLPMLVRMLPALAQTRVVVTAEQTSLWLPAVLPLPSRFVNMLHGAGSMMNRTDRRRRVPYKTLVAAERERQALASFGVPPEQIAVIGYAKAGFRHRTMLRPRFAEDRPIILYTPHWQKHRSSWWRWGPQVLEALLASGRYNVIFAPHQRLPERAPEVRSVVERLAGRPDVHCDLDSFAMVDGSYTAAADIYLGDTSSQVVEFLMRPRPCVFLDAQGVDWEGDASYDMWKAGQVVSNIEQLLPSLARATEQQPLFHDAQVAFASGSLGDTSGGAAYRAAREVISCLS